MFENVIVGVDGGEGGRDAIALAKTLRSEDGALTLVYIYPREPRTWRGTTEAYDPAERDRAMELLRKAQEEAGIQAHLRVHGTVSVGRGLHELGEQVGADLLVVGSSRQGLLGRVCLGDDTREALNGAPCAVAVAPAGYRPETPAIREVGVGYDGSEESEHALAIARKLAEADKAKLSAFHAIFFEARYYSSPAWPDKATIEEELAAARKRIAALGGVEPRVGYGDPAEELALYSRSVDVLVIGSRNYGPGGRLVHGSTAQKLARAARCPLLVLTRAAPDTSAASRDERETTSATL